LFQQGIKPGLGNAFSEAFDPESTKNLGADAAPLQDEKEEEVLP